MKYIANPVIVDAFKIMKILNAHPDEFDILLENNERVIINPSMLSRYKPVIGDYYIIQEDGYAYVNPKDVFERKYRKASYIPSK